MIWPVNRSFGPFMHFLNLFQHLAAHVEVFLKRHETSENSFLRLKRLLRISFVPSDPSWSQSSFACLGRNQAFLAIFNNRSEETRCFIPKSGFRKCEVKVSCEPGVVRVALFSPSPFWNMFSQSDMSKCFDLANICINRS